MKNPLRFTADLRTLGVLMVYLGVSVAAWKLDPHGLACALVVAWLAVNAWLAAVIAHNVVHSPVFTERWMNQAFQVWVSLSYGFPISDYVPGHNLSHHRYTQMREDVMRTTKVRFRWNLLNLLFFLPAVTPAILRGNAEYRKLAGWRSAQWRRQLMLEAVVVWSVKVGLLLLDWRKALLFVVIPHLYANFGVVTINFLQHDGCDPDHPANHSRNFIDPVLNFLAFNNGYHGMHHVTPGLHWSLLPQAHAREIHPQIHPALEQRSLVAYLFRTFVYPGKRITYDGKPVVITNEGPDRSWVRPGDSELEASDTATGEALGAT